ncbi:MAG: hypothetical protein ACP5K4_10885, partial [Caldisericum sp.]
MKPKTRFKQTEIGEIPEDWEVKELGEVLVEKNQGINTTTEKINYSKEGVPVIRAKNIYPYKIDFNDITYVNIETFNERVKEEYKPKKGNILYTNIGSQFGNAALIKTDCKFMIAWNV